MNYFRRRAFVKLTQTSKDLIEDWERACTQTSKADSTFDFLMWLKINRDEHRLNSVADETHQEVFSKIDCTNCANCCKTLRPQVTNTDIERIASFLRISEAEFIEKYLKIIGDLQRMAGNDSPRTGTE